MKKNQIVNNEPKKIFKYEDKKDDKEQKLKKSHTALDPNHTHFILVDNQKLNEYAGETDLRSNLESAISNYQVKDGESEKIPIVVLVVSKRYFLCFVG